MIALSIGMQVENRKIIKARKDNYLSAGPVIYTSVKKMQEIMNEMRKVMNPVLPNNSFRFPEL